MHYRTRYKVSAVPFVLVSVCLAALVAVLWVPRVAPTLSKQIPMLPWLIIGVALALPLAFGVWYLMSYVEVRRNVLAIRSLLTVHAVDLRLLVGAEVFGKGNIDAGTPSGTSGESGGRKRFELVLRLEDAEQRVLWLPLNAWRDEDLLMARVLRATVERRVRIEGDPMLVRRFSGLLDSYKSWDRQQAAA
ncbi:MAG: hypothetical protein JWM86_1835 [Thermoleophilia bacterium]|nr:hypothetical protein [Thermoleophilia bacterium]